MGLVRTLIDRDQEYAETSLPKGCESCTMGICISLHQQVSGLCHWKFRVDGVVSYKINGYAEGSTISGSDPADRFIMGLLRAATDAVMVGARIVHDEGPKGLWIPE